MHTTTHTRLRQLGGADLALSILKGVSFALLVCLITMVLPNELGKTLHSIVIGGAAGVYCGNSLSIDQKPYPIRLIIHSTSFMLFATLSLFGVFHPYLLGVAWFCHGCYDLLCYYCVIPSNIQAWYMITCASTDIALAIFIFCWY
ncbi:unnamed protein product [Rotaria sp. Silwood1]|nr:unnamed protein product [Rotaria sp. Silwood1]CAF3556618.1 unnamed protein product [Rotaria sp. Silwood1]CAF3697277.1 unnamed protein product [Rotaria sp. Silwood1]CAF4513853.1 unnamed protein product [Rotaria sp. Silwood1]CAF4559699.1 unnamed protein product [Rotaria sp. Silwood1]